MVQHARPLGAWCLALGASLGAPAGAAISYVQGAVETGRGTTAAVTLANSQVAGDLNVIFIAWANTDAQVVSVTDTSGNLYLRAGSISHPGIASEVAYYAGNIARAVPRRNTVGVLFSAPVDRAILGIAEYHGADPRNPVDVAAGATGTSAIADTGHWVTSNADDLLVASALTAGRILGPGPLYTQRLLPEGGSFILEDNAVSVAGHYGATALQSAGGWYLIQLVALRSAPGSAVTRPPYPQSRVITGVHWDFSTLRSHRKAIGSDIWPMTWAADGNLYAAWGDGGGFDGTERSKDTGRASLGFARVSGTPDATDASSISGKNVWGQAPAFAEAQATFGGKVVDLISVNGVLYAQGGLWTAANCRCRDPTMKSEHNPTERTLAWSEDLGSTWRLAPWISATDLGCSLQFGENYAGAFDPAHVYLYYQRDVQGDPGRVYLRRVRSTEMAADPEAPGHFEFWAGLQAGVPQWSTTEADAKAVFLDPNVAAGTFVVASVVFDAPLGRYLLTAWHGPATGQVGFFESQTPWGPWATVAYYDDWGGLNETAGEATGFSLPTKWISADGRTLWAVFSGVNNGADNEFDSLNLVRGVLH